MPATKTKKARKRPAGPAAKPARPGDLNGLTSARARVAIARDVLKHLKSGKFTAVCGLYCELVPKPGVQTRSLFTAADACRGTQVRTVLRRRVDACDVCAKGALFVAHVLRFDRLQVDPAMVGQYGGGLAQTAEDGHGVDEYFDPGTLRQIEACFEGYDVTASRRRGRPDARLADAASRWWDAYCSPADRLAAIMRNLIDHDGRFVPARLP